MRLLGISPYTLFSELLPYASSLRYTLSMQYRSYHDLLEEEFEKRRQYNGAYSLRAFARDLGISAPSLSQIFKKKHGISQTTAKKIAQKLKFDEEKAKWFFCSISAQHARSARERHENQKKLEVYKKSAQVFTEIHLEYFKIISDWYHYAILELTYLDDFSKDLNWIANRLGITTKQVNEAIKRMLKLELIKEENNTYIDCFKYVATPNDIPSLSLKKFHTQLMQKALEALYEQDVLNREISSNIVSIDKSKLPEIKNKLRDFRREFEYEMNQHKNKNAVYCLGMQFTELTRR